MEEDNKYTVPSGLQHLTLRWKKIGKRGEFYSNRCWHSRFIVSTGGAIASSRSAIVRWRYIYWGMQSGAEDNYHTYTEAVGSWT